MNELSRRSLLKSAIAGGVAATANLASDDKLRIGVTDWNLHEGAKPDAVVTAAKLGFAGVQVSFGRQIVDGKLPVDNGDVIGRYLALSKQHNIPIDGTCVDMLHVNGLKSDKLAQKWVLDSIRLTRELQSKVLLLPFFGKWALKTDAEKDYVGDALRDLGPEAQKAGVILGLEDTISAEDNLRIMERSRSKNVLVYYDVGNSTLAGFDVVKEIRWLGANRICQFHLKDNPHFLGEGQIQFRPILEAIKDIGFQGYANLETDARQDAVEADMHRNLAYIRNLLTSV